MIRFIIYRFFQLIPVLLLVSIFVFALIHALPGDAIDALAGEAETNDPARRAALEKQLGLDQPIYVQYFTWLGKIVLYGDFGKSITTRRSIGVEVFKRIPATVYLAVVAVIISLVIAVPLGTIAALKHRSYGGLYGDHRSGGRGLHSPTSGSPFSACCSSPSTWAGCQRRSMSVPSTTRGWASNTSYCRGRRSGCAWRRSPRASPVPRCWTKSTRITSIPPVPSGCPNGG